MVGLVSSQEINVGEEEVVTLVKLPSRHKGLKVPTYAHRFIGVEVHRWRLIDY